MSSRSLIIACVLVVVSVLAIVGALLFARYTQTERQIENAPFTKVRTAEEGTYTDLDGNFVSLDEYAGAPLVMVAWASWCPQCAELLSLLSKVAKEVNVAGPILAINRKESGDMAKSYLALTGQQEGLIYLLDTQDHFFKVSGGYAMPELIVYDENGEEVSHIRGTATEEQVRQVFELLNTGAK